MEEKMTEGRRGEEEEEEGEEGEVEFLPCKHLLSCYLKHQLSPTDLE